MTYIRMESVSRNHTHIVYNDFRELIAERHLPIDMITNTIIVSQGALWKHRMFRDAPNPGQNRKQGTSLPTSGTAIIIESQIFVHLLDLHRALLEVGRRELKEPLPTDGPDSLAQRITATFRRTLPALRIASKWLRANIKYMMSDPEFLAFKEKESRKGKQVDKRVMNKISGDSNGTLKFWRSYAEFARALSAAYPLDQLPSLTAPLEEDVDLRGFLPLKKMMGEGNSAAGGGVPNEEQLMRIADLLEDANALVNLDVSICV